MPYIIKCDCGTDMEAPDKDAVIDKGIEHAKADHAMTVTREQLEGFVELVDA
jgi:predicted small metal-binding protein